MTPPVLNNDKRLFKLGGVIHFGGPEGDRTLEPHGCEPCALPAELRAHNVRCVRTFVSIKLNGDYYSILF